MGNEPLRVCIGACGHYSQLIAMKSADVQLTKINRNENKRTKYYRHTRLVDDSTHFRRRLKAHLCCVYLTDATYGAQFSNEASINFLTYLLTYSCAN